MRRARNGTAEVKRNTVSSLTVALVLLAGCGLPLVDPDGTEAALAEQAAALRELSPSGGNDVVSMAHNSLLLDPGVREAASLVAASADEIRIKRAALFPSLGLSIDGGFGEASHGDPALRLTARQLLLDFGDTQRAATEADFDMQINYLEFQSAVDETLVKALDAYSDVAVQRRMVNVRKQQLAAMRELQTLVTRRHEQGATSNLDVLETRKRVEATRFLLHDAEIMLAEAEDRIARLSGKVSGGVLPRTLSQSCRPAAGSPEVLIAQLKLAKALVTQERAEGARWPRVYIAPFARTRFSDQDVSVGLNFEVDSNLFQGGATSARANAAKTRVDGARAGVEAAQRDADLDKLQLERDLKAAKRRAELQRRQIELLKETRGLYRSQYFDLGTRQISDLLDNEEEYYNILAEQVSLRSDMVELQLQCAQRNDVLRRVMGTSDYAIYGLPLGLEKGSVESE